MKVCKVNFVDGPLAGTSALAAIPRLAAIDEETKVLGWYRPGDGDNWYWHVEREDLINDVTTNADDLADMIRRYP